MFPLAFILYKRKHFWLISEVDFDARDNGLHFFEYLNKKHKEINSIYLISKNNPLFSYVKSIGNTAEPHSLKHLLIFIAADAKISTLVHGCSPSPYITKYLLKHHCTGKNIALKHGIFKNIHPNYFLKNAHLDLICCGAKPEYEFINKEFGYPNGVAQYTGLARFDGLHNINVNKEILIMPTWRRWLDNLESKEAFEQTDYFKSWLMLLTNDKFLRIVKEDNISVYFYVHPKLNKYLGAFKTLDCNLQFLSSSNGDSVQKYLKSSAILITDFSSVFFDFAYMRKPAIYYQFDEEQYYESHYAKAYFDYRRDGFGEVCKTANEAIDTLVSIIENGTKMSDAYLSRAQSFFPLYDTNNCERIFNSIMAVISK